MQTMTAPAASAQETEHAVSLTRSEVLADIEAAEAAAHDDRYFGSEHKRIQRMKDPEAAQAARARVTAEACGNHPQTGEPYYTPEDFIRELKLRADHGFSEPKLGQKTWRSLRAVEVVPNMALRDEYLRQVERGETNAGTIAARIGEFRARGEEQIGDASRVERVLGLEPVKGSMRPDGVRNPSSLRLLVPADMAARLADALGMTYQDAGV
jgi:hypothetical protein